MFLSRFVRGFALSSLCLIPLSVRAFDDDPTHRLVHKDLDHPMLEIHGPVGTCSATAQAAKSMGADNPPTPKSAPGDTTSTSMSPMVVRNADGTITIQKQPPNTGAKDAKAKKGLVIPPQVVIPIVPTPENDKPKAPTQRKN